MQPRIPYREDRASSLLSELIGAPTEVLDVGADVVVRGRSCIGAFVDTAYLQVDIAGVHATLGAESTAVVPSHLRAGYPSGHCLVWPHLAGASPTVDTVSTFLAGWRDQVAGRTDLGIPEWDPIETPMHWLTHSRDWCSDRERNEIRVALQALAAIADGIGRSFPRVVTYNQSTTPGGIVAVGDTVRAGYRWAMLSSAPFEWELAGLVGFGNRVLRDEFFMQRVAQRLGVVTDWAAVNYLAVLRDLWDLAALTMCEGTDAVRARAAYLRMVVFAAAGIESLS